MIIGISSADVLLPDRSPSGNFAWGGAGWARIGQYVDYYTARGHQVVVGILWKHKGEVVIDPLPSQASTDFSNPGPSPFAVAPDIILLQRIMHDGVDKAIKLAKANGQAVINDLDDWFWGLDPSNQAFAATHVKNEHNGGQNTKNYMTNLAASSLLTVSTPYLAERMAEKVKCPIVVVPNYIDVSRFTPVRQTRGVPTFGWAGSTGHRSGDLETVAGVLRPRINDGSIRMHHSGDHLSSPPLFHLLGVDDDKVTRTQRVPAADYPSLLHFDVGIVPLRDTPFNYAKSDIKGLEYAASGIPFIAQSTPAYKQLHEDWDGDFWLARRPNDWAKGIKYFQDYDNRLRAQQRLLHHVLNRDITIGAATWVQLLEEQL